MKSWANCQAALILCDGREKTTKGTIRALFKHLFPCKQLKFIAHQKFVPSALPSCCLDRTDILP